MMTPKMMCRIPNPAPMRMFPTDSGTKHAAMPRIMKQIPMTGTARMENAPLLMNDAPYNSSQTAGSGANMFERMSASVMSAPAIRGALYEMKKRRAGAAVK